MKNFIEKIEQYEGCQIIINAFDEIIAVNELDEETIVYSDAKKVINKVFDNQKIYITDPSVQPILENIKVVSGKEYIEIMFNGDYDDALRFLVQFANI